MILRIGTWNLAGRWDERHRDVLSQLGCDVLLLTEVPERAAVPGYVIHMTVASMAPGRRWAAVASNESLRPLPDPHGASALAEVDGLIVCSSILPWRTCGSALPWQGSTTGEKTAQAVVAIERSRPHVWGGDWNHALTGREWAGSLAGRQSLLGVVERLRLQVPTADLPHQIHGLVSIDHVAVADAWTVRDARRVPAQAGAARLSDHDAYVVDVARAVQEVAL